MDIQMLTAGLIRLLDVEPAGEAGHFLGHRKPGGVGRVYGGQVVGQALAAAAKTVAEDRPVHSLHCYFMRPGSEDYPIDYHVEADMDGRAFSNRRIVARQQGKAIFNMIASFHRPERGPAHQSDMPPVADPDGLKDLGDLIREFDLPAGPVLRWIAGSSSPVRFRPVGAIQSGIVVPNDREPQMCWMRVGGGDPLGLGQPMQRAMLGFISDMLLLATAYRPHGLHIGSAGVTSASIDHLRAGISMRGTGAWSPAWRRKGSFVSAIPIEPDRKGRCRRSPSPAQLFTLSYRPFSMPGACAERRGCACRSCRASCSKEICLPCNLRNLSL